MRRLAEIQGVEDVEVRVEDVDRYTSAANAYTTGIGPSRKVFLWNTLLDGRFRDEEVRAVTAHEFGHQSQNHLWKAIALVRAVRRARGVGDRPHHPPPRRDATPRGRPPRRCSCWPSLSLVALPLQNVISRHMEQEADWQALETTRDPDAVTGLFQTLRETSLGDPTPPGWAYVLLDTHPPLLDRIEMAQAWKARNPGATPLFDR